MNELPVVRQEFGFERTVCGCAYCSAYCRHRPGCLAPADLDRLCPPGHDVFTWAEQHLRARVDRAYPGLVPAQRDGGACHWHFEGKCAVHGAAPYGCAFFDTHMADAEADRRFDAVVRAVRDNATANGLYHRVWQHLRRRGLVAPPCDEDSLTASFRRIRRGRRQPAVS